MVLIIWALFPCLREVLSLRQAREEKKLIADKLREWNRPRDDLLCDDLLPFPASLPVPSRISPYFGEMVMLAEFLSTFGEHLSLESRFPDGMSLGQCRTVCLVHLGGYIV